MRDVWKTISLVSNGLEIVCMPGIGGRLWDVKFHDHSLLFKNYDLVGQEIDLNALSRLPTRSPQFGFPLWGGEKTWIAPDREWLDGVPFPVLDSAPYEIISQDPRQIQMRSARCPQSGLQVERRLTVLTDSRWTIHHTIRNCWPETRFTGIWSVLMLNRPARIGLDNGTVSETIPVFGDAEGLVKTHGRFTVFDCHKAQEFKRGASQNGQVLARIICEDAAIWCECTTRAGSPDDVFAHGHNFEVFNSGDYPYCEAEWHSPARYLKSGESLTLFQTFSLYAGQEYLPTEKFTDQVQELASCMS